MGSASTSSATWTPRNKRAAARTTTIMTLRFRGHVNKKLFRRAKEGRKMEGSSAGDVTAWITKIPFRARTRGFRGRAAPHPLMMNAGGSLAERERKSDLLVITQRATRLKRGEQAEGKKWRLF